MPLVLLLSPAIWRNVCPFATIGDGGPATPGTNPAAEKVVPPLLPPVLALFVLILLRATLLQGSPEATAGVLVAMTGVAFWKGRQAPGKAGFCNRLCPLLPVERLYGQSPLVEVGNDRCGDCDLCSAVGCIDLNPRSAIPQILGRERHGHEWLTSPFGVFAAGLSGLIIAFSQQPADASVPVRIGILAAGPMLSWGVGWVLVRGLDLSWRIAVPVFAATAAAAHFWTSLPGVLEVWSAPWNPAPFQWAAMAFVGIWWLRALDSPRRDRLVRLSARRSDSHRA